MPTNHRTSFAKKCSDDPAARQRTPGCSVRASETKFEPHPRTKMKIGVSPSAPSLNEVSAPKKEYSLNPLNVSNEPVITTDKTDTDTVNVNVNVNDNQNVSNPQNSSLSHVKFNYIDEDTRKLHENYIKKFKEHHTTTPEDIMAAEMSQSTYIKDQDIMHDYINRVSKISEQGYTLHPDPKTHNEYMKTFLNKETGKIAVAYRGTQTWIGQDGRANLANTVQLTKFRQMISDHMNVDLRTKKAKILQETNEYLKSNYGDDVTLTTGHSQGSHDSTQAKRNFFNKAKSVVFQPAPGGEVRLDEGKMFTTPNDIVSMQGKLKAKLTMGQMYKMNYTQSTDASVLNRLTGGHMLDNQAAAVPSAVGESNLNLIPPENTKFTAAKNIGRGVATGFLPGIISDALVENVAPDQNEHAKTAEKAVLTAGGERVVSSMVAGTSAGFAEAVVPVYASFEAANFTHDALSNYMKDDTTTPEAVKEGLSGAYSGAAGGATFAGASAAQTAVVNVARSALASTAETASAAAAETAGVEMATMGTAAAVETAELTGLAAAEAGLLTATEVTGTLAASEAGLNPVLDALFIATAFGAGVGGLIGLISGATSQNNSESEQEKEYRLQREAFARADAAYTIEQHRLQMEENARQKATEERGSYIEYIKHKGSKFQDQGIKAQGDTVREALESYDKNVNLPGYDPYRDLYAETAVERNEMKAMNLESEDSLEIMNSANSDTLSQTVV